MNLNKINNYICLIYCGNIIKADLLKFPISLEEQLENSSFVLQIIINNLSQLITKFTIQYCALQYYVLLDYLYINVPKAFQNEDFDRLKE